MKTKGKSKKAKVKRQKAKGKSKKTKVRRPKTEDRRDESLRVASREGLREGFFKTKDNNRKK